MEPSSETSSTFSNHNWLAVVVALGMTGMFYCYSYAMRPLLKSPLEAKAKQAKGEWMPPVNRPRENTEMATKHLSHRQWAVNAKYQIRDKETFIYTNEWEQIDDDQAVKFSPFAMILKSKKGKKPLTVVADSAYIKFESKFSPTNPKPGKIVSGSLDGVVLIEGADGLQMVGRNFTFSDSAQRIWSDHKVSFTFGEHSGKALGMELELIPEQNPKKNSLLEVIGIRSVRLQRDVDLHLQTGSRKKGQDPKKQQRRMVQIRSAGSFDFVSTDNTATFLRDVQIFRPTKPNEYDSLRCDRLTLFFKEKPKKQNEPDDMEMVAVVENKTSTEEKNPEEEKKPEKKRRFQGISNALEFQRLVAEAEGKNVLLISQKNHLKAKMSELLYDGTTRVVQLVHPKNVEVMHRMSQMHSPEITLINNEKNQVQSVICNGAGHMEHFDEKTGLLQFAAKWEEHLRKFPDQKSNLDIIELKKNVLVREPPRKMGLAANYVRLWVNRQESASNKSDKQTRNSFRPQRLLALENVAMVSPEMQAETERLAIWFEESNNVPQRKKENNDIGKKDDKKNNPLLVASNEQPLSSENKKERHPIAIQSKLIRVRVLRSKDGKQSHVAEVWTEGDVKVTQKRNNSKKPLQVAGDKMHVVNQSEESQVLTIFGKPAQIHDGGMHMEGEEIHLDRKNNKAWIEGAGLLELPIDKSLDGKKLEQPELLDVIWKEKMVFNGETASFYGDVKTQLDENRMTCQHMEVQLTKAISFTESENNEERQKNKIKSIICRDGVEVESHEYLDNKLQSIRKASFFQLTVDQLTGKSIAQGPGWVTIWRRSDGKAIRNPAIRTVQANQPVKKEEQKKWEYLRVDFAGKTSGNLKDRISTFRDRVRVVYGPVDKPDETINSDDLPKNAGWMRCKTLQLTQHEKTKTEKAYLEMIARGNAELDGNRFHARADMISFDESKDLYMLRSVGKQKATIWRQSTPGGDYSQADAQRMEFIPSRNKLKLDRATGLQGVQ